MAQFHPLEVTGIENTIRDAVVVTLVPQSGDFSFTQGQYLTFRKEIEGVDIRRSYSICAGRDEGQLQVGIKRVDGGAFSTWANETLKVGDTLDAMQPMGQFYSPLDPSARKQYLCFAGGSGITPVLSILKTTLKVEPESRITLVYANRGINTIMFREEIEDLKNQHMGRLNIIHILENGSEDIDLFRGRLSEEKCSQLFSSWIDASTVDTAFICGPEPMMEAITSSLRQHGLSDEQIKFELFLSSQPGRLSHKKIIKNKVQKPTDLRIDLEGASHSLTMNRDQSLLDAAIENRIDAPYACKAGVCSTCKCKLLQGEVEMISNHALEDYEVEAGYVLSCQSYPLTEKIVIEYEPH